MGAQVAQQASGPRAQALGPGAGAPVRAGPRSRRSVPLGKSSRARLGRSCLQETALLMLHLLKLLQANKNKDCGYKQLSGRVFKGPSVIHHMHIAKTWSTASLGPMHRFLWVALCAFLVTATCRCGPARKREALQVLFRSQSVPFLRPAPPRPRAPRHPLARKIPT